MECKGSLSIKIGNEGIQDEFNHLDDTIMKNGRSKNDNKRRLAQAKTAFYHKKNCLL